MDLCELEATVRAVELEPAKFPHITSFEARARREFIEQTQHELTRLKNGISSVEIQQKMAPVFPQPKSIRRQDPSIRPSIAEVPKPSFVFQSNRIDIDDPLKKSSLFFGMQSEQQQVRKYQQSCNEYWNVK